MKYIKPNNEFYPTQEVPEKIIFANLIWKAKS